MRGDFCAFRREQAGEFRSVGDVVNQQELADAVFHDAWREPEVRGDFRIVEALADEVKYGPLTLGQAAQGVVGHSLSIPP